MMENGINTLWGLFSDSRRIIKVPNYQRAYAWGTKQLDEFIDDIKNQSLNSNKSYYMGTLLIQEAGQEGKFEHFYIVDGQQRLTTVVMFVLALIDRLKKEVESEDYEDEFEAFIFRKNTAKFQTIDADNAFFISYILKGSPTSSFSTPSQKRLYEAIKKFREKVAKLSLDEAKKYLDTIINTKVLLYVVKDSAEATLIFETTNDRGKQLTDLESLKSFFMHKAYLAAEDPESLIQEIEGHFASIYREYEQMEKNIDEDDVLRYFFIAEWEWKKKEQFQRVKDEIKATFNILLNDGKHDECVLLLSDRVRLLKEYFERMRKLIGNEIKSPQLDDLKALGRIATFYPILLKAFQSRNDESFHDYKKAIRLCEMFAFKGYGLAGKRSDTGLMWFYECARDFDKDFDELANWLKDALSWWQIPQSFERALDDPNFYYKGSDARYLLWKYENHLREAKGHQLIPAETYMDRKSKTAFSIEHILAQKDKDNVKKTLIDQEVDDSFREAYLHHLGNLAIDPLSSNIRKSNLPVEEKQFRFFNKAPLVSHLELEEIAQKYGGWNSEAIEKRAETIMKFALNHWDVEKV